MSQDKKHPRLLRMRDPRQEDDWGGLKELVSAQDVFGLSFTPTSLPLLLLRFLTAFFKDELRMVTVTLIVGSACTGTAVNQFFPCIISFNPLHNMTKQVMLIPPFHR